jgi:hypothetical protein
MRDAVNISLIHQSEFKKDRRGVVEVKKYIFLYSIAINRTAAVVLGIDKIKQFTDYKSFYNLQLTRHRTGGKKYWLYTMSLHKQVREILKRGDAGKQLVVHLYIPPLFWPTLPPSPPSPRPRLLSRLKLGW